MTDKLSALSVAELKEQARNTFYQPARDALDELARRATEGEADTRRMDWLEARYENDDLGDIPEPDDALNFRAAIDTGIAFTTARALPHPEPEPRTP